MSTSRQPAPTVKTPVAAFIAATAAVAIALLAVAAAGFDGDSLNAIAILAGFSVMAEIFDIRLFTSSRVSVSAAAIVAAGTISGLEGACIVALAAAAADYAAHRKPFYKAVFNAGTLVTAGAAYVGVFQHFPVGNDSGGWSDLIVPALAGVTVNFAVNSLMVGAVINLDRGISIFEVFRDHFASLLPFYAVFGALAAVVASAYEADGTGAMAVAIVPIVMTRFILKQAIEGGHQRLQPAGA